MTVVAARGIAHTAGSPMSNPTIRICFVCLGNICRSPTAEGVMKHLVEQAGFGERFEIDSAGTGAYHVGEPADERAAEAARKQGIELTSEARQFVADDYDTFDYVIAMDRKNHVHLQRLARRAADRDKLFMLRKFDEKADGVDVPDPYFEFNFDEVFEICRAGCAGLLEHIVRERGLSR